MECHQGAGKPTEESGHQLNLSSESSNSEHIWFEGWDSMAGFTYEVVSSEFSPGMSKTKHSSERRLVENQL